MMGGLRRCVVVACLLALLGGLWAWFDRGEPRAGTAIFIGVVYGCDRLQATEEGRGLFYWLRIDLSAPGIELYVTPLDASAVAQGWQYRLRGIKGVVNREHLAVAINATMFTSDSGWLLRMPGDFAKSLETVVADHVVSHIWENTYLLWFEDRLTPHLRASKPPSGAELAQAKWGIGGQEVALQDGKVWPGNDRHPDARTAVGILAVGEYISPWLALERLAAVGAKDGMLLDGGGSSAMAIRQRRRANFSRSCVRRMAACGDLFWCEGPTVSFAALTFWAQAKVADVVHAGIAMLRGVGIKTHAQSRIG
jgi:hypothetical protein